MAVRTAGVTVVAIRNNPADTAPSRGLLTTGKKEVLY